MTPAQLTTFKAAILAEADAGVVAARAAGNHGPIADFYNANGAGSVWKPSLSVAELNTAIVWSAFAALSVQAQNCYLALTQSGSIDPRSANVRNGFSSIFGAGQTLTNLTAIASRVPTRFEALFTTANITAVYGQLVSTGDVAQALGS